MTYASENAVSPEPEPIVELNTTLLRPTWVESDPKDEATERLNGELHRLLDRAYALGAPQDDEKFGVSFKTEGRESLILEKQGTLFQVTYFEGDSKVYMTTAVDDQGIIDRLNMLAKIYDPKFPLGVHDFLPHCADLAEQVDAIVCLSGEDAEWINLNVPDIKEGCIADSYAELNDWIAKANYEEDFINRTNAAVRRLTTLIGQEELKKTETDKERESVRLERTQDTEANKLSVGYIFGNSQADLDIHFDKNGDIIKVVTGTSISAKKEERISLAVHEQLEHIASRAEVLLSAPSSQQQAKPETPTL